MIPKKLHYVWVGSPLPDRQCAYIRTWQEHNPDYELVLWNEGNIDLSNRFIATALRQRKWAKVADAVRLAAVLTQGGIYLDTDFRVFRSFDPLLAHSCFFGFQCEAHPTDWVNNGLFGAVPGHWFVRRAWDRLTAMRSAPFGLERPTKFGPKLITRLLREEGLCRYGREGVAVKDVFVYPTRAFYPFRWDEEFSDSCIMPDTYAAHFWEKSWVDSLPLSVRIATRLRAGLARMLTASGRARADTVAISKAARGDQG